MTNNKTRIIEVIGPAASGKSTLMSLLNSEARLIKAGIGVWKQPALRLAISAFRCLPTGLSIKFNDRSFGRQEFKQMVRMDALYSYLNGIAKPGVLSQKPNALILDEGPVFAIAKLRVDQQNHLQIFEDWEAKTIERWAQLLDAVIWLDAPDEILIERIRARAKNHRMKTKDKQEIKEFLSRYRDAFEETAQKLVRRSDVKVFNFDSGHSTAEEIANTVKGAITIGHTKPIADFNFSRKEYVYEETSL